MNQKLSVQDQGSVSGCYGCGPDNQNGLRLKSFWNGDALVAEFKPQSFHNAGQPTIVYGGLLASLIDCHSCNLAIAQYYRDEKRDIGTSPKIFCVTAQLNVSFLSPAPIDSPLILNAVIRTREGRKTWIDCTLSANGKVCAKGDVLAIRIEPKI